MDSRMLLFGIASLGTVLVLGYLIGRWTRPAGEEPPAGEPRATASHVAPSAGDVVAPSADGLDAQIAQLEQDLAAHKLRKETLERERYGDPIAWPEDPPQIHEPGWFEANFRAAAAACAPDVEVVAVSCEEPPCFVQLRGGEADWWRQCPGWVEHYTSEGCSETGSRACAGGGEERYHFVAPADVDWFAPDAEGQEAFHERWDQRTGEARVRWTCAGEA